MGKIRKRLMQYTEAYPCLLYTSFVIRMKNQDVIIQDGELTKADTLSSGTKAGIAVAGMLTAIINCLLYTSTDFLQIGNQIICNGFLLFRQGRIKFLEMF